MVKHIFLAIFTFLRLLTGFEDNHGSIRHSNIGISSSWWPKHNLRLLRISKFRHEPHKKMYEDNENCVTRIIITTGSCLRAALLT